MLPVYARDVLHVGASGFAGELTAIGVGAAIAALSLAGLGQRTRPGRLLLGGSVLFGLSLGAAAIFPNYWAALGLFTLAGWTMALNGILSNTMLQTEAPDHLRGRVMGVYSFLVLGLVPFGSLQAGFVSEHLGVRWSIGLGGLVCILVAVGVGSYMAGSPGRLYRAARQSVA
jgi:MFS family permease